MRVKSALLLLILSIVFFISCSKTQYGIITASKALILREHATMESDRIGVIPSGSIVVINSIDGPRESLYKITANWYRITYNNVDGWAFGGFIKPLKSGLSRAYRSETEKFVEFYEYRNKDFDMTVNLCQGVGTISGKFSKENKLLRCKVKSVDFSGFLGENINVFHMKIVDDETIEYIGSTIGCGPYEKLLLHKFNK